MSEHIKITLMEKKEKTGVYVVYARKGGIPLGTIKWYAPWRQYTFIPYSDTVWETSCLRYIAKFLAKLMKERKKGDGVSA